MQGKISQVFNKVIHILEYVIAVVMLLALIWLLGTEVYKMIAQDGYFDDSDIYLNSILTIVVGLEFVRMLINLTPANTLEVLIVAIARQVIVNHESAINNIVCVLCIAGLFAIKRFLIPKPELKVELSDMPEEKLSIK